MFATRIGFGPDGNFFIDIVGNEKNKRNCKGKSLLIALNDFTALDIETTGLSPEYDSIIELAAVRYRNGSPVDKYSQLVNPGFSIDEFITELTGITDEMLSTMPKIGEALPGFIAFVGNDVVVGHNVNFDVNFIYDKSVENGLSPFSNNFVDTMRMSKRLYKSWSSYKLDCLIENLGLEKREAHRALNDAELTAEAYRVMCTESNFEIAMTLSQEKKARDFVAQDGYIDEDNPLFGKVCVFTGALQKLNRAEAMQIVTNIGGICADSVTKKTNLLILGNADYWASRNDGKSAKHKKAEKLKLSGNDIEIISENVFYDMIASHFNGQGDE